MCAATTSGGHFMWVRGIATERTTRLSSRRRWPMRWSILVLTSVLATSLAPPASAATLHIPGAAYQIAAHLDDLTTTGTVATGHPVQADWAGLTSAGLPVPR